MSSLSVATIRKAVAAGTLEWLLTDSLAFGLTTATPLQRAICRIIEGEPLGNLADHPVVRGAVGDVSGVTARPREIIELGAIRSAKSLLASAAAVRASQVCDLSGIRESDVPRVSIVSLDLDKANVVLQDHLLGSLRRSPLLRHILVEEETSSESVILRHPSGRHVEVRVVAGKRAGGSLVSRWSAGCIFDEAPRMVGSDDGVINLDHARQAIMGRLLPGAQIFEIGSPWGPFGPVYELTEAHWGKPTNDLVVIRAKGPDMNPMWWTPERCEELARTNPDAYRTDVLAEFLTPEESLFSSDALANVTRKSAADLPYDPACTYVAAMDPAMRGNSWCLILVTREGQKRTVAVARQWTGSSSRPLSPKEVFAEMAPLLREYNVDEVATDQYSFDALRELALDAGIQLINCQLTETEKAKAYLDLRTKIVEQSIDLPDNNQLQSDLRRVKRKATQSGIQIVLPRTADGRHCDFAPALMLASSRHIPDARLRYADVAEHEQNKMFKAAQKRWGRTGKVNY